MNKIQIILLALLSFYVNWLWVDYASEMDFTLYNYLELWVFALIQYFFASIGLFSIILYLIDYRKKEELDGLKIGDNHV